MPHRWIGITCLAFTLSLAGCGSPQPDDLIKEQIRQWHEAAGILEGISDEAALRDACPRLDTLAQQMVEVNKKAGALEIDVDIKRRLDADNRKEEQAVLKRFNEAAQKVCAIPGGNSVLLRFRRAANRTF